MKIFASKVFIDTTKAFWQSFTMVEERIDSIVETLKQYATTKRYLGELWEKPKLKESELPLILVDFVGDEIEERERTLIFNLYFIGVAMSSNEKLRSSNHARLIALIEECDKALLQMQIGGVVRLRRLKKIYDDVTTKGYVSVFTRQIEIIEECLW